MEGRAQPDARPYSADMARTAASLASSTFAIAMSLAPLICGGCQGQGAGPPPMNTLADPTRDSQAQLARLTQWMSGSFTSAAQAARDPDFRVIELHMTPIWTDRTDGRWLYVEQATTTAREKPYRQRVYRATVAEDTAPGTTSGAMPSPVRLRIDVHEFAGDPLRYVGAWQQTNRLGDLKPEDLLLREGCSITLRPDGDAFVGGTEGHGCPSSLRGASYATSEVRVGNGVLMSWDRGWDPSGAQVWGPRTGGYEFVKMATTGP